MTIPPRNALRTPEMYEKYTNAKKQDDCFMCKAANYGNVEERWILIPNDYPYDRISDKHDMFVHRMHLSMGELTADDFKDLLYRIRLLSKENTYSGVVWNFPETQSAPGHAHVHLIKYK